SSISDDQWTTGLVFCHLGTLSYVLGNYATAHSQLQESLQIFKALGDLRRVAIALAYLGTVTHALGADHESWHYFHEALKLAIKTLATPVALDVFIGMATLLVKVGGTARALELLHLIIDHPAATMEAQNRAKHLLAELASRIPPQVIAAAKEPGKTRTVEVVAAELLGAREVAG
ncbi:MAG TPA: hypothetical protein VGJ87_20660, partial [Roseiflexaceae bacterium]